MSTPQLLDLHGELQVRIFKIRYVVFLKGSGLELPRAGKPLDSSEAPRDLKTIPPHGVAGGGLAIIWKEWLNLEIMSSCSSYFDTRISSLALIRDAAWLITGDFNDISGNHEKQGGRERSEASFADFMVFLSEGDLYDLQHSGESLSWKGKRGTHEVKCRLDRALANSSWSELYPSERCEYLHFDSSNHRLVVTYFEPLERLRKSIEEKTTSLQPDVELLKGMEQELLEAYRSEENY